MLRQFAELDSVERNPNLFKSLVPPNFFAKRVQMKTSLRKTGRIILGLVSLPILFIAGFLLLALLGGLAPATLKKADDALELRPPIYLVSNMLHADIALPVNSLTLQEFAFLREAGFPLDNPNLEYLVVGWGSKAFYTSTRDYADMRWSTIWKAATGDSSVMHVAPAGPISPADGVTAVHMSERQFAKLVSFISRQFQRSNGAPEIIPGATFGYGDVFYEAHDRFHLFNPCNVWVSRAFAEVGLASGWWTPTTFSLLLNHRLYNFD